MTYKEMLYLLKNKIYNTFTTTYLLNESKDSNMDYLKDKENNLNRSDDCAYEYSVGHLGTLLTGTLNGCIMQVEGG